MKIVTPKKDKFTFNNVQIGELFRVKGDETIYRLIAGCEENTTYVLNVETGEIVRGINKNKEISFVIATLLEDGFSTFIKENCTDKISSYKTSLEWMFNDMGRQPFKTMEEANLITGYRRKILTLIENLDSDIQTLHMLDTDEVKKTRIG